MKSVINYMFIDCKSYSQWFSNVFRCGETKFNLAELKLFVNFSSITSHNLENTFFKCFPLLNVIEVNSQNN